MTEAIYTFGDLRSLVQAREWGEAIRVGELLGLLDYVLGYYFRIVWKGNILGEGQKHLTLYERGLRYEILPSIKRVRYPLFEISSMPEIPLFNIRYTQFNIESEGD